VEALRGPVVAFFGDKSVADRLGAPPMLSASLPLALALLDLVLL
jgi:hypothetical protein